MKQLCLLFIAASMFFSCCTSQNDNNQDFIPGLYVKEIKQEFAIGMDTISIKVLDKHASTYKIVRKSNYRQRIDGRFLSPKEEIHNWIAYYDQDKKKLVEPNNERVFTFLSDKKILLMGTSRFRKVE